MVSSLLNLGSENLTEVTSACLLLVLGGPLHSDRLLVCQPKSPVCVSPFPSPYPSTPALQRSDKSAVTYAQPGCEAPSLSWLKQR